MDVKLKYENIQEDYIKNLLKARDIENIDDFLNPSEKLLNDPGKLSQIEAGRQLLEREFHKDARILLVVDSDADGYCSSAIMYQYLKEMNPNVNIEYVCHEGKQHGLEDIHVRFDLNDYNLVILPDAGTNDGIICALYPSTSFLIIDHHEPSNGDWIQPINMVIINNQMSANYPNKNLCGGGVTWQFVRYLSKFTGIDANKYMDLAAVATVGDLMVSTQPENRYIIREGLANLQNPLLIELAKQRLDKIGNLSEITQYRIGWYITPLINGMCRSGRYEEKMRMVEGFVDGNSLMQDLKRGATEGDMVTKAQTAAREASNAKSRQDTKRKKMTELVEVMMETQGLLDNKILIFELDETFSDMPVELNGLIANQLAQKYNRPTLIVRENSNGYLRGSARGVDTIDMPGLKDFFMESGFFEYAEGHQNAHGVSLHSSQKEQFLSWANKELADINMDESTWHVDFFRSGQSDDIADIITQVDLYENLWGVGNPVPRIYVNKINLQSADVVVMGKKRNTVKITKNGIAYMFFTQTPNQISELTKHSHFQLEVVGEMQVNEYYGNYTPQIKVLDYSITSDHLSF